MKTTTKQFNEFKKWVLYYMEKFKLDEWDCYFSLKEIISMAQAEYKYLGRSINFTLNEEVEKLNLKEISLKEIARHEVCHILSAELNSLIGAFCTEDEQKLADEKLAVKLTKLLADK